MRTLLRLSALSFLVLLAIGCKKDPTKNPSEGDKRPEQEEYAGVDLYAITLYKLY